MAPPSGDHFTIRIGGDASAPVVAGHDNHIEIHHPQPAPVPVPAPDDQPLGRSQTNTANDHATVFTVMNGDMHIHHDDAPQPPLSPRGPSDPFGLPDRSRE